MMRTVKRISVALGSLATMTLLSNATYVATQNVSANSLSGNSRVTFTGNTDPASSLKLTRVSNFDFGSSELRSGTNTMTVLGDYSISVEDTRGGDQGYQVQAKASEMKTASAAVPGQSSGLTLPISSFKLTIGNGNTNSIGGSILGSQNSEIYTVANTIATGDANSNGLNSTGSVSAAVDFANTGVKALEYSGTIDYTLLDVKV
ncbi:MAG: WxL domain-containing protein [Leuconostoc pseudomesenteroides]|uniref:WxL domain-containing protein n=1 Tax=Leuconostoc pseudomesenteroides TaxID=33968 RepID=UPI0039EB3F36